MVLYEVWVSLDPWKKFDEDRITIEITKKVFNRLDTQFSFSGQPAKNSF